METNQIVLLKQGRNRYSLRMPDVDGVSRLAAALFSRPKESRPEGVVITWPVNPHFTGAHVIATWLERSDKFKGISIEVEN